MMVLNETALTHLSQAFENIPFNRLLGLQLAELKSDLVAIRFAMQEQLIGNFLQGILHGGVISSVLDMAGGITVMSAIIHQNEPRSIADLTEAIGKTGTVDLQISYLRKGRGNSFLAKSNLIKVGKHLAFTRMELSNEAGVLIATGTGTYLLNTSSLNETRVLS